MIMYGFPCEMDFSHKQNESPNPTRVAKQRQWDSETSQVVLDLVKW